MTDIGLVLRTLPPGGSPLDTKRAATSPDIGTAMLAGGSTITVGIGIAIGISGTAITVVGVDADMLSDGMR